MEIWLWALIGILALMVIALSVKIYLLRKAAGEIEEGFAERLAADTNTLIAISSRDRAMRGLADAVNAQLRQLRNEHHRFCTGDRELKNAVTNISHDLRTPLTAICGYLELLEQEELPKQAGRYIEIIRNRTEALKKLTEELFRYSVILARGDMAASGPVAVNRVLEESIAAFYADFCGRGITPCVQMPEGDVIRCLDPSALSRVFSNLLNNALKYSEGDLDIILSESGEITFSNTAHGLDKVQTAQLFDRFFTVETAGKSTGLGLAIAKTLVEQMDGTIAAEYRHGRLGIRICFPE